MPIHGFPDPISVSIRNLHVIQSERCILSKSRNLSKHSIPIGREEVTIGWESNQTLVQEMMQKWRFSNGSVQSQVFKLLINPTSGGIENRSQVSGGF